MPEYFESLEGDEKKWLKADVTCASAIYHTELVPLIRTNTQLQITMPERVVPMCLTNAIRLQILLFCVPCWCSVNLDEVQLSICKGGHTDLWSLWRVQCLFLRGQT